MLRLKFLIIFITIAILALGVSESESAPEPKKKRIRITVKKSKSKGHTQHGSTCIPPEQQEVVEAGTLCAQISPKCSGANAIARCKNFKWEIESCSGSDVCSTGIWGNARCMQRDDVEC
ncbi:hypothetical protein BKA69DRAFT_37324 [Paraphysoderma sedebokerense]|nr:hypothetical protein BKA69DRAFT_37324 [Paraphysoderma sedebokerense]